MLLTNSQPPSPSSSSTHERVQLLYGIENIAKVQSQVVYNAKARIDVCVDSKSPSVVIEGEHVKNILLDAITNRGIKYRYITEINQSNIQYCKKLSKIIHEIRHLNGIRGNFAVTESEYIATVTIQEAQPVSQVIYSNVRSTVEQHQYLFETLWNSSTPAEKRIKEVEEGIDLGKTEVFQNPVKILESFINIIKSAKQGISLIFPTINAFLREERVGIIELLKQSATKHNVNVRIITPTNDYIEKQIQNISIAVRNEQKEEEEDQEKNNKEKDFFKVQRSKGQQLLQLP